MRKSFFLPALFALALAACGGGEDAFQGGQGGGGAGTSNQVASLTLITSSPTIPSDGSLPATINALARNSANQFVSGAPVLFSATSGGLQVTQQTTDANGVATATLSSAGDPTNRAITVTAVSGGVTATLNVSVSGTSLAVQGPPSLAVGQAGTFTVTLLSAGNQPIANRAVTIASQRNNTLSATTGNTDVNGKVAFTMTPTAGGNDTVTVQTLGLSATQAVTVSSDSFRFTSPAANTEIPLGSSQNVSVTWTVNNAPVVGQTINFATTRGTITGSAVTNASGVATAAVSATNAGGGVITASSASSTTSLAVEFVATAPTSITAQASPFTIATGQTSTITAVVRDAAGNLVKNRRVNFTLQDVTSGQISVPFALTDSQGRAQTVYTASGTTSANEGVKITASVDGVTPAVSSLVSLTVARREVFISIGTGNEIKEPTTAQYELEYVVQVTDSNGNGVAGVPVSLRLLSHQYFKGYRVAGATTWGTFYTVTSSTSSVGAGCADEDTNRNGTLDPGEDFNLSTRLEAGNIALVTPTSVTTGEGGYALVKVLYPQEYAYYLTVDLSASTTVQGTEYVRTSRFMLPGSASDFANLASSPPGSSSPFGIAGSCNNKD